MIAALKTLNSSTEHDFLAVGGGLMEFRSTASRISSDMAALIDQVSGDCCCNASHALNRMLEGSAGKSAQIEKSGQALNSLYDLSGRIPQAFRQLRRTVSTFRELCTLTRIESSRLDSFSSTFGHLADEVKPLSETIHSTGESVLDESCRLQLSIQSALQHCIALQSRQVRDLPPLVEGVTSAWQAFEERQTTARDTSLRQAEQYQEVGAAIDQLVTSLQIHDITRQQIEHVEQALEQLLSEFPAKSPVWASPPSKARAVAALQSSQLSSTAQAFASCVERIEGDLESVAIRVQDMAEAGRMLTDAGGDAGDSFFAQMEGCLNAILQAVGSTTAEQAEMQMTALQLEETISRMRVAVDEIREIENRIQRIAINALIGVTHVGPAGNALGRIAEVMQDLALDSSKNTEAAARTLDAMSEAVKQVSGDSSRASGAETDATGAIGEMRAVLAELHSFNVSSRSRVGQIVDAGSRLASEIDALRGHFSAGRLLAQVVQHARGELQRIVGAAADSNDMDHLVHTQDLANLAKHYTMQSERDIHESVAAGAAIELPVQVGVAVDEGDDLGDNVELF